MDGYELHGDDVGSVTVCDDDCPIFKEGQVRSNLACSFSDLWPCSFVTARSISEYSSNLKSDVMYFGIFIINLYIRIYCIRLQVAIL